MIFEAKITHSNAHKYISNMKNGIPNHEIEMYSKITQYIFYDLMEIDRCISK